MILMKQVVVASAPGSAAVWIIVCGVKYRVRDLGSLDRFDVLCRERQIEVPERVVLSVTDLDECPTCPPDGTLILQEGDDPTIYLVRGGLRFGLPSPEEMAAAGLGTDRLVFLPARVGEAFPYGGKWPPRIYAMVTSRLGRRLLTLLHNQQGRRWLAIALGLIASFVLGVLSSVVAAHL